MSVASSLSFNIPNRHYNALNETNFARHLSCNFVVECRFLACSHNKVSLKVTYWNPKASVSEEIRVLEDNVDPRPDDGGSGDDNGKFPPENGDNGGGGEGDEEEEKEFGPILKFEEVMRETEKLGATLPSDILEAAKTTGIRKLLLMRYLELQGLIGPLGFLMRHCSMLRNRMLADPAFLFKIGTELLTAARFHSQNGPIWILGDILTTKSSFEISESCGVPSRPHFRIEMRIHPDAT